jgi:DNA-directed RNA polymerase specialized sigma24 family protein
VALFPAWAYRIVSRRAADAIGRRVRAHCRSRCSNGRSGGHGQDSPHACANPAPGRADRRRRRWTNLIGKSRKR